MKSKVYQVERVVVRRRHDRLLIAMTQMASELLKVTSQEASIPRALAIIGEALDSKRAFVFEANLGSSGALASLHSSWTAPGTATFKAPNFWPIPACAGCPPEFAGLHNGKVVTATRYAGSPTIENFLTQVGLVSVLFVPIMLDGTYWGYVGFDSGLAENSWAADEISVLHTVADLIGASITRERYIKQLATERDEALKKYIEAETSNVAKGSFLTSMSHELRTPLNAIIGFSDMLRSECFGPVGSPKYKEYALDIHSSGKHLLSLINDLLDVAKIEAGKMEIEPRLLGTQDALDHALRVVGAKASERKQTLATKVDPEATTLYADERAFTQIVINLVSNAVKFAPEGGHISVGVRRNASGDYELAVEDDGPGIPKEKLDRLFQPFSQTDNHYNNQNGGTGLGLALVRGLAELHGGRAWLESEEGMGTRAVVVLQAQDKTLQLQTTSEILIAV